MMIAHHTWRPAEKLVESVYDKNERMCWPRSAGPPVWKRETGRCPPYGVLTVVCVCACRGAFLGMCDMPPVFAVDRRFPQIYPYPNEA